MLETIGWALLALGLFGWLIASAVATLAGVIGILMEYFVIPLAHWIVRNNPERSN